MEGGGFVGRALGFEVDICVVGWLPRAELPGVKRLREGV